MKKLAVLSALLLGLTTAVAPAMAATTSTGTFDISATIPSASQVVFVVSEVQANPITFFPKGQGSQPLNFTMQYDSTNGIWLPQRFFAIDLSPRDSSNQPAPANYQSIQFQYNPGLNPNAPNPGLETKGTVTAVRVEGPTGSQTETKLFGSTLGGVNSNANNPLDNNDAIGGFIRVYVGIATGNQTATPGNPADPAGAEPFTNGDAPGTYTGTLIITATLV